MSTPTVYFMGFHHCVNKDGVAVSEPTDLRILSSSLSNAIASAAVESESGLDSETESRKHVASACLSCLSLQWNTVIVKGKTCAVFVMNGDHTVSLKNDISAVTPWNDRIILADNQKQILINSRNSDECVLIEKAESIQQIVHLETCESSQFSIIGQTEANEVGVCSIQECDSESKESSSTLSFNFLPICNHITTVSCGKEHILMLSRIGVVYSYGTGRGQLGNGTTENSLKSNVIEALEGITVLRIAAGGWHSLALADTGDIYTWGWNESGQLGLPCLNKSKSTSSASEKDCVNIQTIPAVLETEAEEINFTDISCGSRHSAAITDKGQLFTWGWNKYGQLGHSVTQHIVDCPTEVTQFSEENLCVQSINCSHWCTFVECKR